MSEPRSTVPVRIAVLFVAGLVVSALAAGAVVATTGAAAQETGVTVSEDEYVEPAPETGDEYFEAASDDDNWISYINPRDDYQMPYRGDGSGKICTILLNEAGEPVVGETVPETTVTIPTGDALAWHDHADPVTVEYPLTDNYERPLDADQFGTSSAVPQGDGYMDSHCIEFHGHAEGTTVEYGEVQVEGDHADDIELVGYVEQPNDDWDTDVDPIADAESYEAVGGNWTYQSEEHERLHGQVVAVLQLDRDGESDGGNETQGESGQEASGEENETEATVVDEDESMPGFGVLVALAALLVAVLARANRPSR